MIRIILVDDHAIVRTGYRRLLDAEPGLQVVGEAASADEANALARRTTPDVALVDLSQKGSSGIEAIRGMLARLPTPRELEVLCMLAHGDSANDIASSLHLSPKTVLNYLSLTWQKLDADNDFKLLHLAARHGLVDMSCAIGA